MKQRGIILLVALGMGLFVRAHQYKERFYYAHDNDLASWIVKNIVVDRHPRLIGQLTTTPGIFVGSLFYYLLIPFYVFGGMDPLYTTAFSWFIGAFSVFSVYWVFSRLNGSKAGAIGSIIYAVSFAVSQNEREVVPTTPVMLWSVWFLYAICRLFSGKKHSLVLLAVLWGLIWHMNLALALLTPLVFLGIFLHRRAYRLRDFVVPVIAFIVLSMPLVAFEIRHGFLQTKAVVSSLIGQGEHAPVVFAQKLRRTVFVAAQNASGLFMAKTGSPAVYYLPLALLLIFTVLCFIEKVPRYNLILFPFWFTLYILFFSFHPINLSEYYLNGLNIIWIYFASLIVGKLANPVSLILVGVLVVVNLNLFLTANINGNNYPNKMALVNSIKEDAQERGYPCVAISYIAWPGYQFGYRYLFWLNKLQVNQPAQGSPVYSIVYPTFLVDRLDEVFGALGLIYPDYAKYKMDEVNLSCQGVDANLSDPMFGFTK